MVPADEHYGQIVTTIVQNNLPRISPVDQRLDALGMQLPAATGDTLEKIFCAFRPHPCRSVELQEEIKHVLKEEEAEWTTTKKLTVSDVSNNRINSAVRRCLFEWILDLGDTQMQLSNSALVYTFHYLDAFLSSLPSFPQTKLPLLAAACVWVASKVCSAENPVAKSWELEHLCELKTKHNCVKGDLQNMEMKVLHVLDWRVQPVTSYRLAHLLMPFVFCRRNARKRFRQYTDYIILAQKLVGSLLIYRHRNLAIAAIVCAAALVGDSGGKDIDETLEIRLLRLTGDISATDCELQRRCRLHTTSTIRLDSLLVLDDEVSAPANNAT
jgi:hypothetical protein